MLGRLCSFGLACCAILRERDLLISLGYSFAGFAVDPVLETGSWSDDERLILVAISAGPLRLENALRQLRHVLHQLNQEVGRANQSDLGTGIGPNPPAPRCRERPPRRSVDPGLTRRRTKDSRICESICHATERDGARSHQRITGAVGNALRGVPLIRD